MAIDNYSRAAKAYDNWLMTDTEMEAQVEKKAFIKHIKKKITDAIADTDDDMAEMLWSGQCKKEFMNVCTYLRLFMRDSAHSKKLSESLDELINEYAHKMAVEAAEDPNNSRFV